MGRPRGRAPPARAGPPPTHNTLTYTLEPDPGFQCLPGRAAGWRLVATQLHQLPSAQVDLDPGVAEAHRAQQQQRNLPNRV